MCSLPPDPQLHAAALLHSAEASAQVRRLGTPASDDTQSCGRRATHFRFAQVKRARVSNRSSSSEASLRRLNSATFASSGKRRSVPLVRGIPPQCPDAWSGFRGPCPRVGRPLRNNQAMPDSPESPERLLLPPDDEYPKTIEMALRAIVKDGIDAGHAIISTIGYERRDIERRPGLTRAIQAAIYRRDAFQCRYCGAELIHTAIMELLGGLYPTAFPFHPGWKGGETHPAILSRSPVVDHIDPGATSGEWRSEANLVTACWPCNGRKADFTLEQLRWRVIDPPSPRWDGLVPYYAPLWQIAGRPKPTYHLAWIRALGVEPPSPQ
jgi:hypothetical protein